jgi:hypothetical protein
VKYWYNWKNIVSPGHKISRRSNIDDVLIINVQRSNTMYILKMFLIIWHSFLHTHLYLFRIFFTANLEYTCIVYQSDMKLKGTQSLGDPPKMIFGTSWF